jgi:type II secretory pathway component PulF
LKALAIMLETDMPLPEALVLLGRCRYFHGIVRKRLLRARDAVERGEPLPESLYREGLLPGNMVPLVESSIRGRNLPWALAQLGESLAQRSVRLTQRLTMLFFPTAVMATGLLVCFVALGIFMPLIRLISELPV